MESTYYWLCVWSRPPPSPSAQPLVLLGGRSREFLGPGADSQSLAELGSLFSQLTGGDCLPKRETARSGVRYFSAGTGLNQITRGDLSSLSSLSHQRSTCFPGPLSSLPWHRLPVQPSSTFISTCPPPLLTVFSLPIANEFDLCSPHPPRSPCTPPLPLKVTSPTPRQTQMVYSSARWSA